MLWSYTAGLREPLEPYLIKINGATDALFKGSMEHPIHFLTEDIKHCSHVVKVYTVKEGQIF